MASREIRPDRRPVAVFDARDEMRLDGESLVFRPPLHYRIRPRALRVIVAEPASS